MTISSVHLHYLFHNSTEIAATNLGTIRQTNSLEAGANSRSYQACYKHIFLLDSGYETMHGKFEQWQRQMGWYGNFSNLNDFLNKLKEAPESHSIVIVRSFYNIDVFKRWWGSFKDGLVSTNMILEELSFLFIANESFLYLHGHGSSRDNDIHYHPTPTRSVPINTMRFVDYLKTAERSFHPTQVPLLDRNLFNPIYKLHIELVICMSGLPQEYRPMRVLDRPACPFGHEFDSKTQQGLIQALSAGDLVKCPHPACANRPHFTFHDLIKVSNLHINSMMQVLSSALIGEGIPASVKGYPFSIYPGVPHGQAPPFLSELKKLWNVPIATNPTFSRSIDALKRTMDKIENDLAQITISHDRSLEYRKSYLWGSNPITAQSEFDQKVQDYFDPAKLAQIQTHVTAIITNFHASTLTATEIDALNTLVQTLYP